jgi:hypothetical protein
MSSLLIQGAAMPKPNNFKIALILILLLATVPGWAQNSPEPPKTFTLQAPAPFGALGVGPGEMGAIAGVRVMGGANIDQVVKGTPFSGTLHTESTRVFADGNRIHQENSSKIWRDRDGRVRTEAQLALPPGLTTDRAPTLITISDPVARVRYVLEPGAMIARKLPFAPELIVRKIESGAPATSPATMQVEIAPPEGPGPVTKDVFFYSASKQIDRSKSEDLGERDFDGVLAKGTRLTTTIPAGEVSNERAIEIVSEHWYSDSLKTTVMTKHSDPWAGDFSSRLTEVNTGDPDPALFTVPSGYRVVEDKFRLGIAGAPAPPK